MLFRHKKKPSQIRRKAHQRYKSNMQPIVYSIRITELGFVYMLSPRFRSHYHCHYRVHDLNIIKHVLLILRSIIVAGLIPCAKNESAGSTVLED